MKLRVKFQQFAHLFLDGVNKQGFRDNTDWGIYVDIEDGEVEIRHQNYDIGNYILITTFQGVTDEIVIEDVIEWYAGSDFTDRASTDIADRLQKDITLEWD
jgi:hypothetical protein